MPRSVQPMEMTEAMPLPMEFLVLKKSYIRRDISTQSKELGSLYAGLVVTVAAEAHCDGHHRLHIPVGQPPRGGGWVSGQTAKGNVLLMPCRDCLNAVVYTVVKEAIIRAGPSTKSQEVDRRKAGQKLVVLEQATSDGHLRARVGFGEWASISTNKGSILMVPDTDLTTQLQQAVVTAQVVAPVRGLHMTGAPYPRTILYT